MLQNMVTFKITSWLIFVHSTKITKTINVARCSYLVWSQRGEVMLIEACLCQPPLTEAGVAGHSLTDDLHSPIIVITRQTLRHSILHLNHLLIQHPRVLWCSEVESSPQLFYLNGRLYVTEPRRLKIKKTTDTETSYLRWFVEKHYHYFSKTIFDYLRI